MPEHFSVLLSKKYQRDSRLSQGLRKYTNCQLLLPWRTCKIVVLEVLRKLGPGSQEKWLQVPGKRELLK